MTAVPVGRRTVGRWMVRSCPRHFQTFQSCPGNQGQNRAGHRRWRTDAPSDKQIAYAENLGIRIPAGITKGRLSDMIEAAKQVRG